MARIRSALAAQKEALEVDGNDILVIARTDCRTVEGLEEAIARCRCYEALGADIVYAEGLQSAGEYEALRSALSPDTPTILAQVQLYGTELGGEQQQTLYSMHEIHNMGYNFALMGVTALQAQVRALKQVASALCSEQGLVDPRSVDNKGQVQLSSFGELKEAVGFHEMEAYDGVNFCE